MMKKAVIILFSSTVPDFLCQIDIVPLTVSCVTVILEFGLYVGYVKDGEKYKSCNSAKEEEIDEDESDKSFKWRKECPSSGKASAFS